jgi:hypothetical protein
MIEAAAAKAILAHIREGELTDGFTARDVHQRGWSNLTEHAWVQVGLDLLVELDYLTIGTIRPGQRGGRPKVTYTINPKIFD